MSNKTATQKTSRIKKLYAQYFGEEGVELEEFDNLPEETQKIIKMFLSAIGEVVE
tara:strand:+ start:476 stop:640 length:165 start_codon:yes stop_codon:yes gene_type:complete